MSMILFLIFFRSERNMPNLKFTKAKQPESCPFCNKVTDEPWQEHVILCSGQRSKCLECEARFKKNGYLLKHMTPP